MKPVNGIESWIETHHEVVSRIAIYLNRNHNLEGVIGRRYEEQGTGGMYELGQELTDKFEAEHEGALWDGNYFDEIEKFLDRELGVNK